jgi:MFS family permease
MGVLGSAGALPALLLGLFAGVWVDRQRRRPLLILADYGRFILLLLVVVAAFTGWLTMSWLYVVTFLVGTFSVLFAITYRAYVPALVTRQGLVQANSRLSLTESLAEITGPGLGGLLVQFIGAPLTLLIDAFSFLVSAVFVGRIQTPEPQPVPTESSVWQEIREGLGYVWQKRPLRVLAISMSVRNFFGNFFAALYALYVLRDIGLSPFVLGLLVGGGGIGALLGASLMNQLTQRWGLGSSLVRAALFKSTLGILIPLASLFPPLAAGALLLINQVLGDIGMAIYLIGAISLRQTLTPDALLGRVNASFEFLVGGLGTIGIFTGGLLGQLLGIRSALVIAVAGIFLSAIYLAVEHKTLQQ